MTVLVSRMNFFWFVASALFFTNNALMQNVRVIHEWEIGQFDYPSMTAEKEALRTGKYIPQNIIVFDADYHAPTNRYFVAMPAFLDGIPASLGEVTGYGSQSYVKPFPTWPDFDTKTYCQTGPPSSVFRTHIDKCGLMWVPDPGVQNSLNSLEQDCPPKLLVYNLNDFEDQEILRYEFPANVVTNQALLVNIVTESYRSDCSDTIAYIADILDYALIVFDFAQKTSWRVNHKYFNVFPTAPVLTSNGISLDLTDGLVGITLGPATDPERKLYFHSLISVHESWAPVSILKNSTATQDRAVLQQNFYLSPGTRAGLSAAEVMTDDGILIYSVIINNDLSCWNSKTPFTQENQHVIMKDDEKFQFINGLKLIDDSLLVTSSKAANYLTGTINYTDTNYRVMVIDNLKQFLQNTPCATSRPIISREKTTGANSCYGPNCEKQQTSIKSSSSTIPESNGAALCDCSACERVPTSSPNTFEPWSGGYQQSTMNDVNAKVVINYDPWTNPPNRFVKPTGYTFRQNEPWIFNF